MNDPSAPGDLRAVLLDIEGTTTPIAFVTDVLFPYARRRLRAYLQAHGGRREHESMLERLRDEHTSALRGGEPVPPWTDEPPAARLASSATYVDWLMDRDRKSTALKELQGLIWEEGYRRGELVGSVFPDVRPALQRWREQRLAVGIFSSGSELAQKLLFGHSSAGDLTGLVQWYFDTRIGSKGDPDSYRQIAAAIGVSAAACLFLADAMRELDAASAAGMQARLVVRPGNASCSKVSAFPVIHSFDEISA